MDPDRLQSLVALFTTRSMWVGCWILWTSRYRQGLRIWHIPLCIGINLSLVYSRVRLQDRSRLSPVVVCSPLIYIRD